MKWQSLQSKSIILQQKGAVENLSLYSHRVSLECFDWFVDAELTDVDTLVSGARRKALVTLPVHVQRWR